MCDQGQVDLGGTETPYQWGYVSIAVFGSQYDIKPINVPTPESRPSANLIELLISRGAPVNIPDIVGSTALHHAAINNKDGDVIKSLLTNGANPNAQDRYGCVPIHNSIMNNQIEATDLCLQHGADLNIADADGITPSSLLITYTSPGMSAVVQKHFRGMAGVDAPLEDKYTCAACGKKTAKNQCSKCRVMRYCDSQCQSKWKFDFTKLFYLISIFTCFTYPYGLLLLPSGQHWRDGHKNACVSFDDTDNTIALIPTYSGHATTFSLEAIAQPLRDAIVGQPDGEGSRPSNQKKDPPMMNTSSSFPSRLVGKPNKTRDFQCSIDPEPQLDSTAYAKLTNAIQEKGTLGLKAYFTSEIDQEGRLRVKIGQVLADQSW
jgi:hypothetical protein